MTKNILLVGSSAKIAKATYHALLDKGYTLYAIQRDSSSGYIRDDKIVTVDSLEDLAAVEAAVTTFSGISFDGVLYFASTYQQDSNGLDLIKQFKSDLYVNAYALAYIAKGITLNEGSKIIAFGDAGLEHPKPGFISYSLSKVALEHVIKNLAVEFAPTSKCYVIRLGPTLAGEHADESAYYSRTLLGGAPRPIGGLIKLIVFILESNDLHMTGSIIDYDGGAYMRRL